MAETRTFDVNELIDGQKFNRKTILFLGIATLALVGDGYDIASVAFIAPELVKQWHIERAALAPVLSVGFIGLLLGGPILGYLGDRYGRKRAILAGMVLFGGFSLLSMLASSLDQLVGLRFITGIGLGGVIPNVIALTAEFAPKRLRGRFVIITNFGVPLGATLPGLVTALFVPQYGWPVVFFVGGILPLLIAALVFFFLPESLKYLVQQRSPSETVVRKTALIFQPSLPANANVRVGTPDVTAVAGGLSPGKLFAGGLGLITPMLWIALSANQLANYFTGSWLPTLLQSAGASTGSAGIASSMFPIGGMIGGLVLILVLDRWGIIPIVVLFVLGAPLIASIGTAHLAHVWLLAIIAAAGFCVVGINFAMNAAMGVIYPTSVRSTGAGWAQAVGRIGSVGGPVLGGVLLSLHLALPQLFYAPALALVVGAVACVVLLWLCVRRFRGFRLDERAAAAAELPPQTVPIAFG